MIYRTSRGDYVEPEKACLCLDMLPSEVEALIQHGRLNVLQVPIPKRLITVTSLKRALKEAGRMVDMKNLEDQIAQQARIEIGAAL